MQTTICESQITLSQIYEDFLERIIMHMSETQTSLEKSADFWEESGRHDLKQMAASIIAAAGLIGGAGFLAGRGEYGGALFVGAFAAAFVEDAIDEFKTSRECLDKAAFKRGEATSSSG